MRDDNLSLNNLNIPPSETAKFDWLNVLHLIAPIALGYVYYRGKQQRAEVEEKLKMEVALREERELQLKQQGVFDKAILQKKIAEIRSEEEERARQTLSRLSDVEHSIKQILDVRCSPVIPRTEREPVERYLLGLSNSERFQSLNMRDGLNQIFLHDSKHCGGGFHNNGQIYRVWMKWWREKVEQEKNLRIERRKMELYLQRQ